MELNKINESSLEDLKSYMDSLEYMPRLDYMLSMLDSSNVNISLPHVKEAMQNYRQELLFIKNMNTKINRDEKIKTIPEVKIVDWLLDVLNNGVKYNYLKQ